MPTREIRGRTYALEPVPVLTSFALQPLLAPPVGKLVGIILGALGGDESLSLATLTTEAVMERLPSLAGEIGTAFGAIKPADLITITRGLLGGASVDGIPLWPVAGSDQKFNELFRGRSRDLWEVLWFAVQVNYPDFLPAGLGNVAPPPAASPSAT